MAAVDHNILAIDLGERRVGLALANGLARLPRPLTTLEQGNSFWEQLEVLVKQESVTEVVIGLPRNLSGEDTDQTRLTRAFADELKQRLALPVYFQDEALTSHQAEAELKQGRHSYTKADIDALSATLILEDYLHSSHNGVSHG